MPHVQAMRAALEACQVWFGLQPKTHRPLSSAPPPPIHPPFPLPAEGVSHTHHGMHDV